MSLITTKKYVFPSNWNGNPPPSGTGWKRIILHLTGHWEDDDFPDNEEDITVLDISELRKIDGTVPTRTVIENIKYDISGLDNVHLKWDRAPKATIAILAKRGEIIHDLVDASDGIGDGTGDLLMGTYPAGGGIGSSYDITLNIRLK